MASLKEFISNSKSFITGITGKASWSDSPAMTLEQVTDRIKAILGKTDQFADPDINLADGSSQIKAIIGLSDDMSVPDITLHEASGQIAAIIGLTGDDSVPEITLHEASGQIAAIIGLTGDDSVPEITLHEASGQIKAIIGLTGDDSVPEITLHGAKAHVDTSISTPATAHGITGWGASAAALAASQSPGTATTVARGDHVHPYPTPGAIGAAAVDGSLSQSFTALNLTVNDYNGLRHATYSGRVVPWDGRVDVIGNLLVSGTSLTVGGTGVSLTSHTHTPASIGAMATSHAANAIAGWSASAAALAASQFPGTAATVSRGDHVHPYPTPGAIGAAAAAGSASNDFSVRTLYYNNVLYPGGTYSASVVHGNTHYYTSIYPNSSAAVISYYGLNNMSDERKKRNIAALEPDEGIALIRKIGRRGIIRYRWHDAPDDAANIIGFSAQELKKAMPAVVREHPSNVAGEGVMLGFDPGAVLALAVDAIRTLDARLSALEARLNAIEGAGPGQS